MSLRASVTQPIYLRQFQTPVQKVNFGLFNFKFDLEAANFHYLCFLLSLKLFTAKCKNERKKDPFKKGFQKSMISKE